MERKQANKNDIVQESNFEAAASIPVLRDTTHTEEVVKPYQDGYVTYQQHADGSLASRPVFSKTYPVPPVSGHRAYGDYDLIHQKRGVRIVSHIEAEGEEAHLEALRIAAKRHQLQNSYVTDDNYMDSDDVAYDHDDQASNNQDDYNAYEDETENAPSLLQKLLGRTRKIGSVANTASNDAGEEMPEQTEFTFARVKKVGGWAAALIISPWIFDNIGANAIPEISHITHNMPVVGHFAKPQETHLNKNPFSGIIHLVEGK